MANYSEAHVCQCLSRLATGRRNSTVTINAGDRQKTGKEFVERIFGLARGLLELGLRPGDVVAISALNSDLYLEWLLAIAYVGGIAAPLNYRWGLEEAKSAMETVRPIMLVIDESSSYWHSRFQRDTIPYLRWHVFIDSPTDIIGGKLVLTTETIMRPALNSLSFNYLSAPQGVALIIFTSGTTGRPKGVAISHMALVVQSLAKLACIGYAEDDVYLHTAPLCHIGGISSALAMLMVGGCHVLVPKFDAASTLKAIEQFHVTCLLTVPAIMADIVSLIRKKNTWNGKESVRKILNGGGGLSNELTKEAIKIFPRAKIFSAYGMTETCSSLAFMTLYDPTTSGNSSHCSQTSSDKKPGQPEGVCVGKPAPHVEIRIGSDEQDSSSSDHHYNVGKILTRGPHVMLGYWGQTPNNEFNINKGAWLDTGDVGMVDGSGNIWLVGRNKGRIKSGGENIYPEEVEGIISQHPGVATCVVIGVPEARLTEMVVACIQLKDNWRWVLDRSAQNKDFALSSDIIQQFCKQKNLTGFKIPRRFVLWRKPFPMTTIGKLKRDLVKEEVVSHMQILSSNL